MKKTTNAPKKLTLDKSTVKILVVRTSIKAGAARVSGPAWTCQCEKTVNC